jgi:hypothetical protein
VPGKLVPFTVAVIDSPVATMAVVKANETDGIPHVPAGGKSTEVQDQV